MGNCLSTPESGNDYNVEEKLQKRSVPPPQPLPVKQWPLEAMMKQEHEQSLKDMELIRKQRIEQLRLPLTVLHIIAQYLDLETFLNMRMTGLPLYRMLTPDLWRYVHFDIRQGAEPENEELGEWPVTKRIGMPNELWQSNRFLYEDKSIQRYIRLGWNDLQEFAKTILRGRLQRAMKNVRYVSIFLVAKTPLHIDAKYINQLRELDPKDIVASYKLRPKIFIDALLTVLIPRYVPNIRRFDVVLRGYEAYSDLPLEELFEYYPKAEQHVFLNDLTGLYYTQLHTEGLRTLVITASSTLWSSVQRTFKSDMPVLPSTVEYFELNHRWMRPESKMSEMLLTDAVMTKFLSKAKNLLALKIHSVHEFDTYDWIPSTLTELSIDDGDENPQYINRARIQLPNVTRFSVTTPYGGIFKKLEFTNLEHLQVGDLDNCECLGPVLASNPKLHTLLMGDSEGTGPIWNVVLRNSQALKTLVMEGEPDVFDPYSNPKTLQLGELRTLGLTVVAEAEQVQLVLQEILSRTPKLQEFYLRCEQLDDEHWGDCVTQTAITEPTENSSYEVHNNERQYENNEVYEDDKYHDDDSLDSGHAFETYLVNIAKCKKAFHIK